MKKLINKLKPIWWQTKLSLARYFYGNPASKLKIIGVTGTNGKTTVATLLYKVSTELGHKAGLISTVENIILKEKLESTHTTPDSVRLTRLFSKMVKRGCEYVFMEVSSHALDQKRVAGVNFTGGIFTNLTHDHLDYHKSLENYFLAKKKLFQMLPSSSFALSNADDEHGHEMLEGISARKFFYSLNKNAPARNAFSIADAGGDFKGEISKLDFFGLELKFNGENVKSKLLGKFNAYNLLTVWSTCSLLGFDMAKVNKILEDITPPKGRFEYFVSQSGLPAQAGVTVVVDYAHTPDALEKIFLAIREIKPEGARIISVFGCGGDRDPLKRRIMGKIGANLSNVAIFTSDNPRNENPNKIIAEMKTDLSMKDVEKVRTIPSRGEAIRESVKLAKSGDIILCAGKGHENYQEIRGVKHHFDDMEEYHKLLI